MKSDLPFMESFVSMLCKVFACGYNTHYMLEYKYNIQNAMGLLLYVAVGQPNQYQRASHINLISLHYRDK